MIQYHQNLIVSTIMVLCFLPFLWSVKFDSQSPIQRVTDHLNDSTISNTSTSSPSSSVNLFNSVQSDHNFLNTTSPSPSPTNTTATLSLSNLSPSSSTTKSFPSSTIINNSVLPKSSADIESSSNKNDSTADSSLSTATMSTNNYTRITLMTDINLNQPVTTILSSQSLSTSQQQQQQDQQQQSTIKTSFPPPFLEFVALSAVLLIITVALLVGAIYGCVKVYHTRYPIRITFGRKFSTFENPIYVQKASSSCEIDTSRENQAGPTELDSNVNLQTIYA
ncbi:putative protein TPRXL [Panonychus citri]|uniref:putative protein TPRXL n=1 Tax=Panonychus citri TaxID=50023 RepID=UPI0023080C0B|nr:putative protein TPRXL [Panonychus citri]